MTLLSSVILPSGNRAIAGTAQVHGRQHCRDVEISGIPEGKILSVIGK